MKNSWFHYLPEVGRGIIRTADQFERDSERIRQLEREIEAIKSDSAKRYNELSDEVGTLWTEEEIQAAKSLYAKEFVASRLKD